LPQERSNPYPNATPEEVAETPGGRGIKAARNIAVRRFGGIPVRAFLLGQNDHSPMLKGIEEFAEEVWVLLDSLEGEINPQIEVVRNMMLDSGVAARSATVEPDAE
jgi:hypothetical protein